MRVGESVFSITKFHVGESTAEHAVLVDIKDLAIVFFGIFEDAVLVCRPGQVQELQPHQTLPLGRLAIVFTEQVCGSTA